MLLELGNALAFLLLASAVPALILGVTRFVRPDHPFSSKLVPYECGELPEGSPYIMFNNRFYLVAIAFLVFDVEIVMLFPILVMFREATVMGGPEAAYIFGVAFTFLTILFLGLIYEWKTGDLDWFQRFDDPRKRVKKEGA